MSTSISACIITYNPNIDKLKENIQSINIQVDVVYIVDNGSKNVIEIDNILETNCDLIKLEKNMGIAYALNVACKLAMNSNYKWILTLDQDSICAHDIVEQYKKHLTLSDIGILHCLIEDNFTGEVDGFMTSDIEKIDECITSCSLTNIEAWKLSGGFDERLFIDLVDFDLCYSMKKNNYNIYRINKVGLKHELGDGRSMRRCFHKHVVLSFHSPFRRYYICRNSIYVNKKHKNKSMIKVVFKQFQYIIIIFFYENKKIAKLYSAIKGLVHGAFMKVSKEEMYDK